MENYTKVDGTVVKNGLDYSKNVNNNLLTLRIQAKFLIEKIKQSKIRKNEIIK